MVTLCSAIMIVLQQTVDYLGEKYAHMTPEMQASIDVAEIHRATRAQWIAVDDAALGGDLVATKTTCRALIAAYKVYFKW